MLAVISYPLSRTPCSKHAGSGPHSVKPIAYHLSIANGNGRDQRFPSAAG